jgi:hypothetical protein
MVRRAHYWALKRGCFIGLIELGASGQVGYFEVISFVQHPAGAALAHLIHTIVQRKKFTK